MSEKGKVQYLTEGQDGVTYVKVKEFGYVVPQLDRIEKKVDSILLKLEEKELPSEFRNYSGTVDLSISVD